VTVSWMKRKRCFWDPLRIMIYFVDKDSMLKRLPSINRGSRYYYLT
jgi:hypothetical protein